MHISIPLSITSQPIDKLIPDPLNPRIHTKKQIRQIACSIKEFGFNGPILVDGQNQILAGHGRLLAAKELGLSEVPTICIDHLNDAQARAFVIADNKLTENAQWDQPLLAQHFQILAASNLNFSLDITGFDLPAIDMIIECGVQDTGKPDPLDDLSRAVAGLAVSQIGDLWQLGKHHIYCGNALDGASFDALMRGETADVIFTDPPYNVKIDGHCTGLGSVRHREFGMAAGEMSELEFTDFLTRACRLLALNSKSGSIHYICMDWRHASELLNAGKLIYTDHKNICVWVKDNGGMGSLYRSQHELVFVFKHGQAPHRNNVELGKHGRYRTNVWNYPGINSFSRKSGEENLLALHPTVKPVALIADALLDCSARGEIVLDSFLGSGSSLLAAQPVGRTCYGMELDPLYVDTAIRRWQHFTGDVAIHAETGNTFDAMVASQGGRP